MVLGEKEKGTRKGLNNLNLSKEQRNGMEDHHAEMAENPPNQHAYEKFKRKAYQSVNVEEYLRKRNHDVKKKI